MIFPVRYGVLTDSSVADRWKDDRTTFQRVYDVPVGSREFLTAEDFADRADCSETGARNALEQFTEMGIAERQEGRPTSYRRNDSSFRWKRVESLARDHSPEELKARIDELIPEEDRFRETYGVPEPEAATTADVPADDHDALHDRWGDFNDWRTVRRDIRILRRAVERAESRVDDSVHA